MKETCGQKDYEQVHVSALETGVWRSNCSISVGVAISTIVATVGIRSGSIGVSVVSISGVSVVSTVVLGFSLGLGLTLENTAISGVGTISVGSAESRVSVVVSVSVRISVVSVVSTVVLGFGLSLGLTLVETSDGVVGGVSTISVRAGEGRVSVVVSVVVRVGVVSIVSVVVAQKVLGISLSLGLSLTLVQVVSSVGIGVGIAVGGGIGGSEGIGVGLSGQVGGSGISDRGSVQGSDGAIPVPDQMLGIGLRFGHSAKNNTSENL